MRSLREFGLLWLERLGPSEWQRTLLMAGFIGVLGSLATIGFREGIFLIEHLLYGRSDSLVKIASGLPPWLRILTPALGGVVAGLVLAIARRVPGPRASGDYMEAIALGSGDLSVRNACLRALSSAATVASGGTIGREGPMVQLAALTGSLFGRWRDAPVPRRRLMVACGAAAGVATAYNAPIAGALFVAEIVFHSVAIESLGPLLVATVAAKLVVDGLLGFAPVYQMPAFTLTHGSDTLVLAALGVLAGLAAPLYLAMLDRAHRLFRGWSAPLWVKLGTGGLVVGLVSVGFPEVWGNGYSVVNSILQGGWLWTTLLAVLAFKLVALSATTGSGAVGGIFTPTLFVGAVSGALFTSAVSAIQPGWIPEPAGVAIGMGAFLAACTHAPLTSVLMIFEMTENYGVVVPLMLACVIGYYVSYRLRPESIYSSSAGVAPPMPELSMAGDLMHRDCATIRPGQSLRELEQVFLRYRWQNVYVVDEQFTFLGAVPLYDLQPLVRERLRADEGDGGPWPQTLMRRDYPRVAATSPVWQVLETFTQHAGERLPVLDPGGRLLGYVTKTDLVLMFRERLSRS